MKTFRARPVYDRKLLITPTAPALPPSLPVKHENRAHNVLSPSSSHRWMVCPASATDESTPMSEPAAEGTAVHELLEMLILAMMQKTGKTPDDFIGETIVVTCDLTKKVFTYQVNREMVNHLTPLLDTIRTLMAKDRRAMLISERRVYADAVYPDLSGTVDVGIILPTLGQIISIDLKYGAGVGVEVIDNSQLIIYLLGLAALAKELFPLTVWGEYVSAIYQPRYPHKGGQYREQHLTPAAMKIWVKEIRECASRADPVNTGREHIPGGHCTWCPKEAKCKALATHALKIAQADFSSKEIAPPLPSELTPKEVAYILDNTRTLKSWLESVYQHALDAAKQGGGIIPGYKLVQGRSTRKWKDDAAAGRAMVALCKKRGIPLSEIQTLQIATAPQAEKKFSREDWETLFSTYGTMSIPAPALAKVEDNREELPNSAALDFQTVKRKPLATPKAKPAKRENVNRI